MFDESCGLSQRDVDNPQNPSEGNKFHPFPLVASSDLLVSFVIKTRRQGSSPVQTMKKIL